MFWTWVQCALPIATEGGASAPREPLAAGGGPCSKTRAATPGRSVGELYRQARTHVQNTHLGASDCLVPRRRGLAFYKSALAFFASAAGASTHSVVIFLATRAVLALKKKCSVDLAKLVGAHFSDVLQQITDRDAMKEGDETSEDGEDEATNEA